MFGLSLTINQQNGVLHVMCDHLRQTAEKLKERDTLFTDLEFTKGIVQ